jgi:hypothetical protein
MNNWTLLFSTTQFAEANIVKGVLEENNIPVQLLNKQDSSYLVFGEIELYVPMHLKEIAQQLLNKVLLN